MNISTLELILARDRRERDEALRLRILEAVRKQQRPFKPQPGIARWLAQYVMPYRERYSFLVLVGRSKTGKTCLGRQLCCQPHETLELNCATGAEPDLRAFDRELHKAILFDEATPKMVLQQKKLFQAAPAWIQLASSTTNCLGYSVMAAAVPLIIASNTWKELCVELSAADLEWIQSNQILVEINDVVYCEDEGVSMAPVGEQLVVAASQ